MNELLKEYAKVIIHSGIGVKEGKLLRINIQAKNYEFARLLVDEAYKAGARKVMVEFSDDEINHIEYLSCKEEVLKELPDWQLEKMHYVVDNKALMLSIASPTPDLMNDVNPKLIRDIRMANIQKTEFMMNYSSSPECQWCIAALPSYAWAKKVFPKLDENEAYEKLLHAILDACRISKDGTSTEKWNEHIASIRNHNKILTDYNFKSLHFKNGKGTDLNVELVHDHIWCGGDEVTPEGVHFNPNMPTEETFTCPDKYGVNGIVYATKPLEFAGKLITDFYIKFENGKVIDYDASTGKDALQALVEYDETSCYLGEVALVDHDSPISKSGILFYNTLFDENASCHLALGRCYTINAKGANDFTKEQLEKHHMNYSLTHCDFMFGSADMKVIGEKQDGTKVTIMENGNFVI